MINKFYFIFFKTKAKFILLTIFFIFLILFCIIYINNNKVLSSNTKDNNNNNIQNDSYYSKQNINKLIKQSQNYPIDNNTILESKNYLNDCKVANYYPQYNPNIKYFYDQNFLDNAVSFNSFSSYLDSNSNENYLEANNYSPIIMREMTNIYLFTANFSFFFPNGININNENLHSIYLNNYEVNTITQYNITSLENNNAYIFNSYFNNISNYSNIPIIEYYLFIGEKYIYLYLSINYFGNVKITNDAQNHLVKYNMLMNDSSSMFNQTYFLMFKHPGNMNFLINEINDNEYKIPPLAPLCPTCDNIPSTQNGTLLNSLLSIYDHFAWTSDVSSSDKTQSFTKCYPNEYYLNNYLLQPINIFMHKLTQLLLDNKVQIIASKNIETKLSEPLSFYLKNKNYLTNFDANKNLFILTNESTCESKNFILLMHIENNLINNKNSIYYSANFKNKINIKNFFYNQYYFVFTKDAAGKKFLSEDFAIPLIPLNKFNFINGDPTTIKFIVPAIFKYKLALLILILIFIILFLIYIFLIYKWKKYRLKNLIFTSDLLHQKSKTFLHIKVNKLINNFWHSILIFFIKKSFKNKNNNLKNKLNKK